MRTPGTSSRVLIVSGSVGAGHDGAARELAARLRSAGVEVAVRDFLDAAPRPAAWVLREGYLATVERVPQVFEAFFRDLERHGPFWRAEQRLCAKGGTTLARWVAEWEPDVVVATYPPAAQAVGILRADGRIPVPAVIYLTDPAAHVSWLHPAVDLHLTVTAATVAHAAAAYGAALEVGGPLVPDRFAHRPPAAELAALRAELGDGRPLALLTAGSLGIGDLRTAVDDVTAAGFTAVVLCGRNETLRRRLTGPGVAALGWRDDVHRLMHAADVLVQNAGGLSFTESLVAGLPAVTYRPIPGHGRANARVLDEAGLAPWAHDRAELAHHLHASLGRARTPVPAPDPAEKLLGLLGRARTEVAA